MNNTENDTFSPSEELSNNKLFQHIMQKLNSDNPDEIAKGIENFKMFQAKLEEDFGSIQAKEEFVKKVIEVKANSVAEMREKAMMDAPEEYEVELAEDFKEEELPNRSLNNLQVTDSLRKQLKTDDISMEDVRADVIGLKDDQSYESLFEGVGVKHHPQQEFMSWRGNGEGAPRQFKETDRFLIADCPAEIQALLKLHNPRIPTVSIKEILKQAKHKPNMTPDILRKLLPEPYDAYSTQEALQRQRAGVKYTS